MATFSAVEFIAYTVVVALFAFANGYFFDK